MIEERPVSTKSLLAEALTGKFYHKYPRPGIVCGYDFNRKWPFMPVGQERDMTGIVWQGKR